MGTEFDVEAYKKMQQQLNEMREKKKVETIIRKEANKELYETADKLSSELKKKFDLEQIQTIGGKIMRDAYLARKAKDNGNKKK